MNISNCCKAEIKIEGDEKEGTYYYVCTKCNAPCDYLNKEEYIDRFEMDYEGEIIEIIKQS